MKDMKASELSWFVTSYSDHSICVSHSPTNFTKSVALEYYCTFMVVSIYSDLLSGSAWWSLDSTKISNHMFPDRLLKTTIIWSLLIQRSKPSTWIMPSRKWHCSSYNSSFPFTSYSSVVAQDACNLVCIIVSSIRSLKSNLSQKTLISKRWYVEIEDLGHNV
jgi:hypothetical protein